MKEGNKMIKTIKDKLIVLLFAVNLAFVVSTAASNLIYAGGHIHNADIQVTTTDIEASNGVINVIDTVLIH
jgi:uncharacterized surface protein with fasciclin (FAS1) repeats